MSTQASSKCPQCGTPLPPDAPAGLCPRCVMALNFGTETVLTEEPPAPAPPPLPPEAIAPHFPQLEILECLGRGGMGIVYKARQKSLGRFVALKLLAPEREKDPQFAERFAREAQALAALNHPHIVTVHDFGQSGGFYYLIMEFVDGVNLRQLLRAKKLTPEEALAIVPPICEALQFAHERGIVHRDIKPENLLLDKNGRVKIADFGIAKMLGPEAVAEEEKIAGTPEYMAPEQRATPKAADHRADIYSLGVVFYEMLTGERPAKSIEPPSRKVQVDVRLDEIVLRALETSPDRRYHSAAELRTEVETYTAADNPGAEDTRKSKTVSHPSQGGLLSYLGLRTRAAVMLARLSLLGFLGFLGSVPGGERLWGFSGFFGFLGSALVVELYSRLSPRSRRLTWSTALAAALLLLACFVWPDRDGQSNGPQTANAWKYGATWSFGAGKPWMKEMDVYEPQRQMWSEFDPTAPSLFAGVLSLMLLITLGAMQGAERDATKSPGGALLRLRTPGNERRIQWGNVFVAGIIMMAAGVNGALLFCALMQATFGGAPSVLSTAILAGLLSLAALVGALTKSRPDLSSALDREKRPSSAGRWFKLAVAVLIIPPVFFATVMFIWYLSLKAPSPLHSVEAVVPAPAHGISHIETTGHGAFFVQTPKGLHYVLYHAGGFDSSSNSSTSNPPDGSWTEEAGLKLKNGRSFGLRRESWNELFLKINGQEYDLRKGRVFECRDDGIVAQLPLFPAQLTTDTLPALGRAISEYNTARGTSGTGGKLLPEVSSPATLKGALLVAEQQVVVPAESRVSVEVFRKLTDGDRTLVAPKLNFKTAVGSGLGVLLQWRAYGPDHPSHANRWVLDIIDPLSGKFIHQVGDGWTNPVQVTSPDVPPLPAGRKLVTI